MLADSVVLMAINNGEVGADDFLRVGPAVNLTSTGRKRFIATFRTSSFRRSGTICRVPAQLPAAPSNSGAAPHALLLGEIPHYPASPRAEGMVMDRGAST
ncbi:MAG: CRISPR-associated endonuclease Cas1 [Gammaproteobacteria bacterium]|nr:CRISPR-associated endonuclease Cas1 [Gammaproteobacteria bacterium]